MVAHERLYIEIDWCIGVTNNPICHLCEGEDESVSHLFFKCSFNASIWTKLLRWQGIMRQVLGWEEEQAWAILF